MKRSEMVDLMWSFIQDVEYQYDIYMKKEDTKELLSEMEKAGMLPPHLDRYEYGEKTPLLADSYISYDFIWEPEDE